MIKIIIDKKTPSINHVYLQKGYRKFIRPEGKKLREYIITKIKKQKINVKKYINKELKIEVKIYENWYTKDNRIYRKDISNREKFMTDSVFTALGLDDKQIFKHTMIKKQSQIEKTVIKIDLL